MGAIRIDILEQMETPLRVAYSKNCRRSQAALKGNQDAIFTSYREQKGEDLKKRGKEYGFGFNGMERDDEVSEQGNAYTAEYWGYDPRIARRKEKDPVTFAWQSSYATFNNNPILYVDPLGLYGSERRAEKMQQRAKNAGWEVGDVYKSGKEWGFAKVDPDNPDDGGHVFGKRDIGIPSSVKQKLANISKPNDNTLTKCCDINIEALKDKSFFNNIFQQSQSTLEVPDRFQNDYERILETGPVFQMTTDYVFTGGLGSVLKSAASLYAVKATVNGYGQMRQNGNINLVELGLYTFAPNNFYGKVLTNTVPNLVDVNLSENGIGITYTDITTITGAMNFTVRTGINAGLGMGSHQLENYLSLTRNGKIGMSIIEQNSSSALQNVWSGYWDYKK